MTKKILAVLFIFLVSVSLSAEPVDMVVMLDTSESVLRYMMILSIYN